MIVELCMDVCVCMCVLCVCVCIVHVIVYKYVCAYKIMLPQVWYIHMYGVSISVNVFQGVCWLVMHVGG